MSLRNLLIPAVLVSGILGAVDFAAIPAAPQSIGRSAPIPEAIANLSIAGIEKTPILLRQGSWDGTPSRTGSSEPPRVELLRDFRLVGDLNSDDSEEAVVLLSSTSVGSGTFLYLAVAGWQGPTVVNVATELIGDRVQVRSGRIAAGRVELDVVQAAPIDPMCCPSQTATRGWTLSHLGLREEPVKNIGTLSLRDLAGKEWRLSYLALNEAAPAEPQLILRLDQNRVSGFGGCNRYFGEIKEGAPGQLTIGPLAGTRMACGDDVDRLESRFQSALQRSTQYGFLAGKLALTYHIDDAVQTMLFETR